MISREQRTPLSEWWWTVDRLLLAAIIALMLAGVILSLAASPPVATRIGLDPFHFFNRHILFPGAVDYRTDRRVLHDAAADPPLGAGRVRDLHRADPGDLADRAGGEGRQALDHHSRHQHPGVGIR